MFDASQITTNAQLANASILAHFRYNAHQRQVKTYSEQMKSSAKEQPQPTWLDRWITEQSHSIHCMLLANQRCTMTKIQPCAARWLGGWGARHVINRSPVHIPATTLSSATLAKLFTHKPLSLSSVTGTSGDAWRLGGWPRSGVALATCHTLSYYGLTSPSTHYRSFRRQVFPVNHLHWYWQPNKNNHETEHTNNIKNNTT